MGIISLFSIFWFLMVMSKILLRTKRLMSKLDSREISLTEGLYKSIVIGGYGGLIGLLVCSIFDYPFGFISLGISVSFILGFLTNMQSQLFRTAKYPEKISKKESAKRVKQIAGVSVFYITAVILIILICSPIIAQKLSENSIKYERLKQYNLVIPYLKYASKFDPLNSAYLEKCGDISLKSVDYDNASKYYSKSLELNPKDSGILNKVGLLTWLSGKRNDARFYFKEALKYDPVGVFNDEHFSNLALNLYNEEKRYPLCFKLLEFAVLFTPFKVNDIFWEIPQTEKIGKIRIVSYDFRAGGETDKFTSLVDDFIKKRLNDSIETDYTSKSEQLVIDTVSHKRTEQSYENAIYLSDILDEIFNRYKYFEKKDPASAQSLLIVLSSAYKLSGNTGKANELMELGNIEKLPYFDKKGNIVEKLELTQ